jgi:transketolase
VDRGAGFEEEWDERAERYEAAHPGLWHQLRLVMEGELPEGWDKELPIFPADAKGLATRDSSGKVLNVLAKSYPWLVGGSADLNPSTKTYLTASSPMRPGDQTGRNIHYGVREHAMGAITNGLALSRLRPFSATFLIFSDYERPAIRLSSIMEIPSIHIYTHDSIGVGEDGPTHQPIEQLSSLRAIPGLIVLRPGDANEVTEAWRVIAPLKHQPVVLVLTRQAMPTLDRTKYAPASGVAQGAYILADSEGTPEVILIGTGSEVSLCVEAYEKLKSEGVKARVVSMPSWELFEQQDEAYREKVLPRAVTARVVVEQAAAFGWERWVGLSGKVIGMRTFGASAPLKNLLQKFGFSTEKVIEAAREVMKPTKR